MHRYCWGHKGPMIPIPIDGLAPFIIVHPNEWFIAQTGLHHLVRIWSYQFLLHPHLFWPNIKVQCIPFFMEVRYEFVRKAHILSLPLNVSASMQWLITLMAAHPCNRQYCRHEGTQLYDQNRHGQEIKRRQRIHHSDTHSFHEYHRLRNSQGITGCASTAALFHRDMYSTFPNAYLCSLT